jgi:hypothetical protein
MGVGRIILCLSSGPNPMVPCTMRVICFKNKCEHVTPVLKQLHWLPIKSRICYKVLLLCYKIICGLAPRYFEGISYALRQTNDRRGPRDLSSTLWRGRGQVLVTWVQVLRTGENWLSIGLAGGQCTLLIWLQCLVVQGVGLVEWSSTRWGYHILVMPKQSFMIHLNDGWQSSTDHEYLSPRKS